MDTVASLIGAGFFAYITFSLVKMIVVAMRAGTVRLYMGRYRRALSPPVSRSQQPGAFWMLVGWYGFLATVTAFLSTATAWWVLRGMVTAK